MRRVRIRPRPPRQLTEFVNGLSPDERTDAAGERDDRAAYQAIPATAKQALRDALAADQQGLCAYCMRRIRCDASTMKIEHVVPQSRAPQRALDWKNLLGVCLGGEGDGGSQPRTCDTAKGERELTIDPRTRSVKTVRYPPNGRVESSDPGMSADLDEVLNLNCAMLVANRKAALDGLVAVLKKRFGLKSGWAAAKLQSVLDDHRTRTTAAEYLGLLEYWLEKRIRVGS